MSNKRRKFSPKEKVRLLRLHHNENNPVRQAQGRLDDNEETYKNTIGRRNSRVV